MEKALQKINCYATFFRTIVRNTFGIKLDPEVRMLSQFIEPGAVCFDIGAAYGRYALTISKLTENSGCLYAFEPAEFSHTVLSAIIRFYGLENVKIIKTALSNEQGTGTLVLPVKKRSKLFPKLAHSLAHLVTDADSNYAPNLVSITTIDQFVSKENLLRLDFIKCDVEGAERLVFEGGKNTLERFKPVILCEVYKTWLKRFHTTPAELHGFFMERGYQAFALKDQKLNAVRSLEEDRNYFFIHSNSGSLIN